MPSHKIHIKIAQDVNKKLKLNNDAIMLGCVLPDLTATKNHGLSHFQFEDKYPYNLANPYEFVKKYPNLKDDISIGYIIHLLTDRFYNDWYYKNYLLRGINTTKELKHNLFESYDKYILKHFKLPKFKNLNIVNSIPNYKDLSFDKNYLNEYITNYNKEIDFTKLDKLYKLNNQNILDTVYNNCLLYVDKEISKIMMTNLK